MNQMISNRSNDFDRITIDSSRLNGQPCIRDLRITVRRVLELRSLYPDREELKAEFPELEDEDIRQALLFASTPTPLADTASE